MKGERRMAEGVASRPPGAAPCGNVGPTTPNLLAIHKNRITT